MLIMMLMHLNLQVHNLSDAQEIFKGKQSALDFSFVFVLPINWHFLHCNAHQNRFLQEHHDITIIS